MFQLNFKALHIFQAFLCIQSFPVYSELIYVEYTHDLVPCRKLGVLKVFLFEYNKVICKHFLQELQGSYDFICCQLYISNDQKLDSAELSCKIILLLLCTRIRADKICFCQYILTF